MAAEAAARLERQLSGMGAVVTGEWCAACAAHLVASQPGFGALPPDRQLQLVFAQLLHADLNLAGGGIVPRHVTGMHKQRLEGRFLLQIDEIANISAPAKERYSERRADASRTLQLHMTDGKQRIVGIEYQPIPQLSPTTPAGTKVLIVHALVRRGMLLLSPESFHVLGGGVTRLEAARCRVVAHWNKPARGIRTQHEHGSNLFAAASAAAWADEAQPNGSDAAQAQQAEAHGSGERHATSHQAVWPCTPDQSPAPAAPAAPFAAQQPRTFHQSSAQPGPEKVPSTIKQINVPTQAQQRTKGPATTSAPQPLRSDSSAAASCVKSAIDSTGNAVYEISDSEDSEEDDASNMSSCPTTDPVAPTNQTQVFGVPPWRESEAQHEERHGRVIDSQEVEDTDEESPPTHPFLDNDAVEDDNIEGDEDQEPEEVDADDDMPFDD